MRTICPQTGPAGGDPRPYSVAVRRAPRTLRNELVGADIDDAVDRARLPVGGVHVLEDRSEIERAAKPRRRSRVDARRGRGRTVAEGRSIDEIRRAAGWWGARIGRPA